MDFGQWALAHLSPYGYAPSSREPRAIRCPLHDDRSPSASVWASSGKWNCQVCNPRGQAATFTGLAKSMGIEPPVDPSYRPERRTPQPGSPASKIWPGDDPAPRAARMAPNPAPAASPPEPDPSPPKALKFDFGDPPRDTPAEAYLVHRKVWPPDWDGDLPVNYWWSPRHKVPRFVKGGSLPFPDTAEGAAVFLFRNARGQIQCAQFEALDHQGNRTPCADREGVKHPRWRKTMGQVKGSLFPIKRRGARAVVITEGPISAIAASWIAPQYTVVSTGGTSGLKYFPDNVFPKTLDIIIEPDRDKSGREAAVAAKYRLEDAGYQVKVNYHITGLGPTDMDKANDSSDLADTLAEVIESDPKEAWQWILNRKKRLEIGGTSER